MEAQEMKMPEAPKNIPFELNASHLYVTFLVSMITLIIYFLMNIDGKKKEKRINIKDLEEKLAKFHPEPLVDGIVESRDKFLPEKVNDTSEKGSPIPFDTFQNLIKCNFYNLINNEELKTVAANCIKRLGVGSCGPRGFYGTIDVHLELEKKLGQLYGVKECQIYAYGLSTMMSVFSAYCKKDDVVFCDEKVRDISTHTIETFKSKLVYFKHNDPADLEYKIRTINKSNKVTPTINLMAFSTGIFHNQRLFVGVEGIYALTGTICPLPEISRICKKYKARLFLDESNSFSIIGKRGLGVIDYHNLTLQDVDFVVGTFEEGIPSIGGFCVSSILHIDHLRLLSPAYCFSASLPPFLSAIALQVLDRFEKQPELFTQLKIVSEEVHKALSKVKGIDLTSFPESPYKVFTLKNTSIDAFEDKIMKKGLVLSTQDNIISFRVNISMDVNFIGRMAEIIEWAAK